MRNGQKNRLISLIAINFRNSLMFFEKCIDVHRKKE